MFGTLAMLNRDDLIQIILSNKIKVKEVSKRKNKNKNNQNNSTVEKIYPKVIQLLKQQLYEGLKNVDLTEIYENFPYFSILKESKDPLNDGLEILMDMIPTVDDKPKDAREKAIKLVDACITLFEQIDDARKAQEKEQAVSTATDSNQIIEFE